MCEGRWAWEWGLLDLDPLHRLSEVIPDERRQLLCGVGHPPHRHSLGAIANGAQVGRRDASYPLGQKVHREPIDKLDAGQVLAEQLPIAAFVRRAELYLLREAPSAKDGAGLGERRAACGCGVHFVA